MKTHYFCIAHKDVLFDLPEETKIICTGDFNLKSRYNIINSTKNLYNRYKILAGTSGNIFINELLTNVSDEDYVHIVAYRKFLSNRALYNENWQIELSKEIIKSREITIVEEIKKISTDFCFAHPLHSVSTLYHYNLFHNVQDFLRFIACAIDLKILIKENIVEFLNCPLLIPGGILIGKYPVATYREIVSKLELIINLFLQNHIVTDASERVIDQCCERLSSWLLIKHLESKFNKPFIKDGTLISWKSNFLIDRERLNFNEFFGYLHMTV